MCGAGNIITNNGNIYASSGAVAASTYLALRGFPVVNSTSEPTSLYSPSNTAGFWYDGANHIISTWNITDDVGITDGNKKGITLFSETGKFTNLISNTGNFTNLYINGKDLSKLGDSSDTAHFWRGDNEWSDTLTGTLHISKDTVNWLDSNSQAAIVIDKKSYNSWISGFTNNGTISITTWPANTSSVSSDMLYFGYIENGHDPKNLYFDKAMTWNGRTGDLTATKVHNAVFNDYAECRATIDLAPGYVVIDKDDGTLECSSKRL